jgi:hypothetical protein
LKITAAVAPAACALSAFTRNVHVPRCINAIRLGCHGECPAGGYHRDPEPGEHEWL